MDTGPVGHRRRRERAARGGLGGAGLSQRDRRRRGGQPGRGHRHPARPDDGKPGGAACGRRPVPADRLAGRARRPQAAGRVGAARSRRPGARRGQGRMADRAAPGSGAGHRGGVVTSRRGVGLTPMETRRDVIVRAAMLADELGYETFALPEGWGLDPAPVLTEIALRTARIRLASGILSVWGRTPATLAMTAATLHQVSGGRYVLGLGASTKALVEGFHDTAFEHPAAKLRDVVTKVRALLAGEPAQLDRTPAARPLRLGQPPASEIPIWVPALVARDRLPEWVSQLRDIREATTSHARPLTVATGPVTVVDEIAEAAR